MLERLLGGSWVVVSRVISTVTILITHIMRLITPLITTPELSRKVAGESFTGQSFLLGWPADVLHQPQNSLKLP